MTSQAGRIGVFDSGVGGLTVVRAVRAALPDRDIAYLGDTARVPYGSKSARTVERYALACQRFLLEREVDLVLVACNTASATALPALAAASQVPVVGVVEPGAASAVAASTCMHIGVIGTLATVGSGAYPRAIHALAPGAAVSAVACPLLVPLAEEGWVDDDIARAVARRYLARLFEQDAEIDTLVLGCTHYPLLAEVLAETAAALVGHPVAIVDSASAMAEVARAHGPDSDGSRRGELACFATDVSRIEELAPRFLGEPLQRFELVDI
ncbi:glutamate racemase [Haliangium ochraceum]|uniref:Glutamate racemase n=1 Tax=Haliangium ochraceum (strain DSM 14365 / JCM 11303 / SMP-2) TaxID=502025 RepID=D0LUF3_HALO1|nr:glutamate racemase [Haliangium ochraceum]ACY19276.1 glutamate racemase [Haliangium ochraceum DSM 14365]